MVDCLPCHQCLGAHVQLRALGDEHAQHGHVVVGRRQVQRQPAAVVAHVDVRTVVQQHGDGLQQGREVWVMALGEREAMPFLTIAESISIMW